MPIPLAFSYIDWWPIWWKSNESCHIDFHQNVGKNVSRALVRIDWQPVSLPRTQGHHLLGDGVVHELGVCLQRRAWPTCPLEHIYLVVALGQWDTRWLQETSNKHCAIRLDYVKIQVQRRQKAHEWGKGLSKSQIVNIWQNIELFFSFSFPFRLVLCLKSLNCSHLHGKTVRRGTRAREPENTWLGERAYVILLKHSRRRH